MNVDQSFELHHAEPDTGKGMTLTVIPPASHMTSPDMSRPNRNRSGPRDEAVRSVGGLIPRHDLRLRAFAVPSTWKIIKTAPAYAGFRPSEMTWQGMRDVWLPDWEESKMLMGVNWSGPRARGYDIEPADIRIAGAVNIGRPLRQCQRRQSEIALECAPDQLGTIGPQNNAMNLTRDLRR